MSAPKQSSKLKPFDSIRVRDIRKEFVCGEEIAKLSPWAQLLCERLPMLCDKNGTFIWRPKSIKKDLFGHVDSMTFEMFESMLVELVACGWIERWTIKSDAEQYATFTPFCDYQYIGGSEATNDSRYPSPELKDVSGLPRTSQDVSIGVGVSIGLSSSISESSSVSPSKSVTTTNIQSKSTPTPNGTGNEKKYTNDDYSVLFGSGSSATAYLEELKEYAKELIPVAKTLGKFPPRSWQDLHDLLLAADIPSLSAVTENVGSRVYRVATETAV